MAYDQRNLDDYIDVAQRIADFRAAYPEGSLGPAAPWEQVCVTGYEKGGEAVTQTFIVFHAAAYRTPGDPRPGVGTAWEVFPGRTPYTRGSELQNAETSAWGRAIIAVGASDSKKGVASREDVRNREADEAVARELRRRAPETTAGGAATVAEQTRMVTGREPGAWRATSTAENDRWYDSPAPLADLVNPEDRHGTCTPDQITALHAAFTRMKVSSRDAKIAWLRTRFGDDIRSSKDLSYTQAASALQETA